MRFFLQGSASFFLFSCPVVGEQQVEKRQIYISDQMDKVEGKEDGKAGSLSIQADNQCNEYFFYGPHSFSWSVSVSRSQ